MLENLISKFCEHLMFKYSFIFKIRLQICGNMKVKPFFNFYISYQVGNDMFKVEKKKLSICVQKLFEFDNKEARKLIGVVLVFSSLTLNTFSTSS